MKDVMCFLCGCVIGAVAVLLWPAGGGEECAAGFGYSVDTVVRVDTVRVVSPAAAGVVVHAPVAVRLPRAEGQSADGANEDADSATVLLPRETRVYERPEWRAVVSGFDVSLDTLDVAARSECVTMVRPVADRRGRWGVSVTAGVGVTRHGVEPSISVGLSFRLFDF